MVSYHLLCADTTQDKNTQGAFEDAMRTRVQSTALSRNQFRSCDVVNMHHRKSEYRYAS